MTSLTRVGDRRLQSGPIVLLLTAFWSLWLSCDPETCGVAWWRRCWAHLATQLGVRRKLAIDGHLWASLIAFFSGVFCPFWWLICFCRRHHPSARRMVRSLQENGEGIGPGNAQWPCKSNPHFPIIPINPLWINRSWFPVTYLLYIYIYPLYIYILHTYGPVSGGPPRDGDGPFVYMDIYKVIQVCVYPYVYIRLYACIYIYTYILWVCIYVCSMCMCKYMQYVYVYANVSHVDAMGVCSHSLHGRTPRPRLAPGCWSQPGRQPGGATKHGDRMWDVPCVHDMNEIKQ